MDPTCGPDSWTRLVDRTREPGLRTALADPTCGPNSRTRSWTQLVHATCAPDFCTRLMRSRLVDPTHQPNSWTRLMGLTCRALTRVVVPDWTRGLSERGWCLTRGSSLRGGLKVFLIGLLVSVSRMQKKILFKC